MVNAMDLYTSRLAEDVVKTYEEKTGDKILPGVDMTKVVEFYGIELEFKKLDLDCVNVFSKIIKSEDTFKIIFDKAYAEKKKASGIGNWNLFLGKMLGLIMLYYADEFEKVDDGTIFYPSKETLNECERMKEEEKRKIEKEKSQLLDELNKIDSGEARDEIISKLALVDKDLAESKSVQKRKKYKITGRKLNQG